MIDEEASADEIGDMALSQGFHTIFEDGKEKVLDGTTSVSELLRAAYING